MHIVHNPLEVHLHNTAPDTAAEAPWRGLDSRHNSAPSRDVCLVAEALAPARHRMEPLPAAALAWGVEVDGSG